MKLGQTWLIPAGRPIAEGLHDIRHALAIKFRITRVGGLGGRMYKVGPGGMYG